MRAAHVLPLTCLLHACGGGGDAAPDAAGAPDAGDLAIDAHAVADAPVELPDAGPPLAGFGDISGECGVLDDEEWTSDSSFAFRNAVDFGIEGYTEADFDALTAGGQEIVLDGNAGGSSIMSEVFAFELLHRCELADLLKTETEISYDTAGGKITDLLVSIDSYRIGVSVTRAVGYPRDDPYTVEQARTLLEDKLADVLASTANVAEEDAWVRQILHVLAACGSGAIDDDSDGGTSDGPIADGVAADSVPSGDAATADAGLVEGAFFVAPGGDDDGPGTIDEPWETIGQAAATLVAGQTVYIRQGTYAERLVPANAGSAGNPISFVAYPGEQATLDGAGVTIPDSWGGLVELATTSHIRVAGLRVINAGVADTHAGILVDRSESITIEDCYTYNSVSSGIGIWRSTDVIVRGNEVELACNDGSQECITVAITDGFEVSHNHVHDSGPGSNGGEGIDIKDGSSNGVVFGNLVERTNRLGIYVDSWDKHTFNVEVRCNTVRNTEATGYAVAAEAGGLLENVRVHNNIAYGNYYSGLTVAGWGEAGHAHPIAQVYIVNNTLWGNGTSGWGPGIVLENPEADDVVIRNNLLSQNASAQLEAASVGDNLVVDHNLFDGSGAPYGSAYVQGNPLLANTGIGDFHLLSGSAAIDQGSATDAPTVDFDGTSRPQGSGFDIGAFELASD